RRPSVSWRAMQRVLAEPPEEGRAVRFRGMIDGREVEAFAVRFQGELRAYVNRCTHRELALDLGEGAFFSESGRTLRCKAHGARCDPLTAAGGERLCPEGSARTPPRVAARDGVPSLLAAAGGWRRSATSRSVASAPAMRCRVSMSHRGSFRSTRS